MVTGNLKLFKACGTLLLANNTKRLLFLLRDNDTHSNTWGLVGGKVEDSETVMQALTREIKEEIGLDDLKVVQGPLIRINKPNNYFCQLYRSSSDKSIAEFNLQKEEVEQLKWFDFDVLKKEYQKQPDNFVPIISKILDLII